jgi:hypothetical protein
VTVQADDSSYDVAGLGGADLDGAALRRLQSRHGLDTSPFYAGDGLFTEWETGQVVDRGDPNARGIHNMLDSDGTARQLEQVLTLPIRAASHSLVGGSERGRELVEANMPEVARARFIGQQTSGIIFRKAFFELDWRVDGRQVRLGQAPAFRPAVACEALFNRDTGRPDGFRKRVHDPGGMYRAQDWRRWYSPPMPGWIPVPRERSHIYVHGTHREPVKGTTDLSVCWWAYETRVKLLFLWMRYIERATDPKVGVYGNTPAEAITNAKAMAKLNSGGFAPLTRPAGETNGKIFEILEAATAAAPLFESASRYLNGHMVDSCLAGFTQLSSGAASAGQGSRALAESDTRFFQDARQAVADEQGWQTTADIFTPLCVYNGLDLADVPQLKIGPLSKDNVSSALDLAQTLLTASTVNAPDEFLDGLLMVVAPTLGQDPDKLRAAIEKHRADQAAQAQSYDDGYGYAGDAGGSGLGQRAGAPDQTGADLANRVDAAYAVVDAAQRGVDPDDALSALYGQPRIPRTHIDLAYNPHQPRVGRGRTGGGRWASRLPGVGGGGQPRRPSPQWLESSIRTATPAERAALHEYSTKRYRDINGQLRADNGLTPDVAATVALIDSALARNPLHGPVKLVRTTDYAEFDAPDAAGLGARIGVGRRDRAYTSASVDWRWPDRPVEVELVVPDGVGVFASYIAEVSKYEYQQEVLMERNLVRVLDDVDYDRKRKIWLAKAHIEVTER